MFQFSNTQTQDLKEAAKIQRRRQFEEERKARIFNAKQRVLGVDSKSLDEQVAEKRRNQQIAAENERKFAEAQRLQAQEIRRQEHKLSLELEKQLADLNLYRKIHQRRPPSPVEPHVEPGISSAQSFPGEDNSIEERKRTQQMQQKAWLEQQILERKQAEEARAKAEETMQKILECQDKRALEIAEAKRKSEHALKTAIAGYNKLLALQSQNRKESLKKAEEQDNMAEIMNQLSSEMLNESLETAQSNFGPTKRIPYMYRGRTPEELLQFKREQELQMEEISKKRSEDLAKETQWQQYSKTINRCALLKENEIEKHHKQKLDEFRKTNEQLAVVQKQHKDFVERVVYTNEATDDYFNQFNTTTR